MDQRPPRVDVLAHDRPRLVLGGQMIRQRAATTGGGHTERRDPDAVENARGCRIDVRFQRGLHAAFHHQHLARVPRHRPRPCAFAARDAIGEVARQQAFDQATHGQGAAEQRRRQQGAAHRPALSGLGRRPSYFGFDQRPPDVDQPPILDARRTCGLAVAAGEATIEVQLRRCGDRAAFEHVLDEIDAATRSVQFVAQQQVRRARRVAKAAVDARAQDGIGFAAVARVAILGGKFGLHQQSASIRPRLKMRCGSKTALSLRCNPASVSSSG